MRLFRLFNAGGPYFEAFTMFDDVYRAKKQVRGECVITLMAINVMLLPVLQKARALSTLLC